MRHILSIPVIVAVAIAGWVCPASADEVALAGRGILEKNKQAVVTVELVIKMQYSMAGAGSQQNEMKSEVSGTVIDASGLTVVSLSATDPAAVYQEMMSHGGEEGSPRIESTVSDVKILKDGGGETPAKIVLRDKDLDLAFVRPQAKEGETYAFVDFAQGAKPEVLDPLVILNRMGKVANHSYSASVGRIAAIMEKPRTFYIPNAGDITNEIGVPVFALDGRVVGITLLRMTKSVGGASGFMGENSPIIVILPADDIVEAAKQAPSYESAPEPAPLASADSASEDGAAATSEPPAVSEAAQ
ncbi:MAG TPA: serine protease [Candidatus Hydrogenedentes bacterium]|nr:serine protease [Candidatus Hydrogenedentota bacterium]